MSIAYLVSQYPAASHTFVRREVEELRSRGLDIQTFSVRRPSFEERRSERDNSAYEETFYILPARLSTLLVAHLRSLFGRPYVYLKVAKLALKHRAPGLRALAWSLFHFAESIVLAQELKLREVKHLHNHFANAAANVGLLAAKFLDITWSVTLHGISETDYPAGLLLSDKIKAAKFVACASFFGRAQAMRITPPEQWHKLVIVRCALKFSELPKAAQGQIRSLPRLICVGRLSPEKGHLGLIQAVDAMRARGVMTELVLVGDGPERDLIQQTVDELELTASVHFAGRLDEAATLRAIAQSDVLVLPSFMEGLPVVLMEAMALGVPVVAARVAGIPELVSNEEEGLLFNPSDWDDLAAKVEWLVRTPNAATRISRAAHKRVSAEFAIEQAVKPLLDCFDRT